MAILELEILHVRLFGSLAYSSFFPTVIAARLLKNEGQKEGKEGDEYKEVASAAESTSPVVQPITLKLDTKHMSQDVMHSTCVSLYYYQHHGRQKNTQLGPETINVSTRFSSSFCIQGAHGV